MNKAQQTVLESILSHGHAITTRGSREYTAAVKLSEMFPLVERETMCGGVVVYMFRLSDHCIKMAAGNFLNQD